MKRSLIYLAVAMFTVTACKQSTEPKESNSTNINVSIKKGWYYINGQKTFINAIGYRAGARPDQRPNENEKRVELARLKNDVKIIKDAGFNAIRTWSELTEPELEIVQKSGLMVIYGIWISPKGNFADPAFIDTAEKQVRNDMTFTKKFNCIITYIIMNASQIKI